MCNGDKGGENERGFGHTLMPLNPLSPSLVLDPSLPPPLSIRRWWLDCQPGHVATSYCAGDPGQHL